MTRDARERTYALQLLVLTLLVSALTLVVTASFTTPPAHAQRAAPSRAFPTCIAYETHQGADSVAYEVWRTRGSPCRVTLPMDARRAARFVRR